MKLEKKIELVRGDIYSCEILMFVFNIFLHFHLILILALKAKMTYPMFCMVDISVFVWQMMQKRQSYSVAHNYAK